MKITLKRVLICGISLLALIFLMIAMLIKNNVITMPGSVAAAKVASGSIWDNLSKTVFHDAYLFRRVAAGSSNIESGVKFDDNTAKTMAVATLIVFIVNLLAITGGFFMKSNKAARGLIIPIFSVSVLFYFIATIIVIAPMSYSKSFDGHLVKFIEPDSSMGAVMMMMVIAIILFIGMLIASGVVKEKELATLGKKGK